jgi:hypothetical protein
MQTLWRGRSNGSLRGHPTGCKRNYIRIDFGKTSRKWQKAENEVRTHFARQRAMHYNERRKTSPLLFVNTRQD